MSEKHPQRIVPERESRVPGIILIFVFLFFLGLAVTETVVDKHPLTISDSGYLGPILTAKKAIQSGEKSFLSFEHYVYPPLFFTISGGVLPLKISDRLSGKIVTWFWMIIGLAGMFLLLKTRFGLNGAMVGVTIFVASPMFRIGVRHINMDVAVFAVFPWFLMVLLQSRMFHSRIYSLITGLVLGLGFLIRWDFPMLVAFPTLYVLVQAIRHRKKDTVPNIILFTIIPICSLVFYLIRFSEIPTADIAADEHLFDNNFSIESLSLYFNLMGKILYGVVLSALAVICIVLGFKADRKNALFIFGVFAWVMFIYTMVPNKNFKYMLIPIFLLGAFVSIVWINSSGPWKLTILLLICLGILPYASMDWSGIHPVPLNTKKEAAKNLYIRPIDMTGPNLLEYRKLLDAAPKGERTVCLVSTGWTEEKSDEKDELDANMSHIGSYTATMVGKSIRTVIKSPSVKNWEGCDALMVPSFHNFRPKIDLRFFHPLIITGGSGISIVWFYASNPDAVKEL